MAADTPAPTIATHGKVKVVHERPKTAALVEMHQEKALDFIRRKASDDKPFYLAYWPNVYDLNVEGTEITTSNSTPFAQNMERLDRHIGEILAELDELEQRCATTLAATDRA